MKRFIMTLAVLALGVSALFAQPMQSLPNDPAVRIGKLENGLTYYIRHNEKPAGRAEFYLATDVGAIQETPDQDGLAHFLEHMCFNGTKNFPEKKLLDWLQSIGASFGGNVNAATGVEQTTYMLNNIPLTRPSIIDSCILIMHDYSHFVLNDPAEIDKERGVIVEERRARRNAQWRLHEKSLPYYYGNTKYAECTLIGSQENLLNFKPESLVNFYQKWYRPDMQALIVVGDVDIDYVEGKIKEIFADIPKPEGVAVKEIFPFEEFSEPRIGILTDPEATNVTLEVLWEMEADPEEYNNTIQMFVFNILKDVISHVAEERFNDITAKADAPFLSANFGVGNLNEFMDVAFGMIASKEGEAQTALKAFLTEIEKLRRFGITDGEFDRAKDDILKGYESAANKADTRQNSQLVYPLINNFFDNEPFMEPSQAHELAKMVFAQALNAQMVNQIIPEMIKGHNNLVIIYKGPEKEGLVNPTVEEFKSILEEVRNSEIQPNEKEDIPESFLDPATLKGSKAGKESKDELGSSLYTLKNGVKVILYPNDIQKDRVSINLSKDGGESLIPTEDLASFDSSIFGLFLNNSGVSEFSGKTVSKMLAGKEIHIEPFIHDLRHGIRGTSGTKEIETALQLVYLYFTQPRFDQEEYNQGVKMLEAYLPNFINQPNYKLQEHLYKTLYGDNPRERLLNLDILHEANLATIEKNYRKLFADAAGATLQISGDFDVATVLPLVEKYIGSIPAGKKATKFVDQHKDILPGSRLDDFSEDMETPKTTVISVYSAPIAFSQKTKAALSAVDYILDMRYVTSLREEEGGTYGAQTVAQIEFEPKNEALLQIYFDCRPSLADKLRQIAEKDLRSLANEGPTEEEFSMAKKNLAKKIPESRETISYWHGIVRDFHRYGFNADKDYEAAVEALTAEDIKAVLAELLAANNHVEVVMRPAKTSEAE